MMSYFSLSGLNLYFYIENMGRDSVPLPIINVYCAGGGKENCVSL